MALIEHAEIGERVQGTFHGVPFEGQVIEGTYDERYPEQFIMKVKFDTSLLCGQYGLKEIGVFRTNYRMGLFKHTLKKKKSIELTASN